ncbi:MAG: MFS transporter [Deltaproteobacteria bacterium]|nr:MFS transporter [Deltaproteobacteria bacterium]
MVYSNYIRFAAANRQFISFGFLAAFTSSFGQTYFIGIFGPALQSEFGLNHTTWGSIYLMGTLGSAAILSVTGKFIDHMPLRRYTLLVLGLLILACGSTAFVTGPVTLIGAIFLLRHAGQGLMSHIAVTTMARYFHAGRGKAIAIATLGYSAGEALLPFIAVLAIGLFSWRWTYGGVALLLAMVMIATRFILPKDFGHRSPDHEDPSDHPQETEPQRSWTRSEVLRDLRIYLLLPGLLAPGIILTAMFFHHLSLAAAKGWSYTWITGSYIIYAGATIVTSLLIGQLIDRLGAVRLVPFMLVPLALAMLVVAIFNNPFAVWLYMVLLGLSVGIAHTSVSAMWAEVYGVAHLGAIKSLMAALSVFGTALGPVSMGSLMDKGLSMEQVCLLFAGYTVMGMGLMVIAFRWKTDETPLVSHRIGD